MQYTFITDEQDLQAFCAQARMADFIAVDTEFVRTRTLYPQLGLIQIYDGKQLVLIDPLPIADCSSLTALLTDQSVVKVLHACSEDLETFWHAFNVMPSPVFDTQFAASLVGMGTSLGYAKIVELMLGVSIDKGESRTDWLARPLSQQQCHYAANDVLYLFQLYPELHTKVDSVEKLPWVYDEMELLATKKRRQIPSELVYLGVKNNWKLTGKKLLTLQHLTAWRLTMARKKDLALNFVVREENLWSIANAQPQTMQALRSVAGMNHHEVRIYGEQLLQIVQECGQADVSDYPPRVERLNYFDEYKNTVAAIKKVCSDIAQQYEIPPAIVGSKKQLNQLIKWCWFKQDETRSMGLEPDLIYGWRKPLFEQELLKISSLQLDKALSGE